MAAWWRDLRVWLAAVLEVALLAALCLAIVVHVRAGSTADRSVVFGCLLALLVALLGGLFTWSWRWSTAAIPDSDTAMVGVTAALARAQARRCQTERAIRLGDDPAFLPLRWEVTARAEAVTARDAIRDRAVAAPMPWQGECAHLADALTRPGSPRGLVILGDAGAGTSTFALSLVCGLLAGRSETDPVPILLPAASWDPDQPLDDWIADRLVADAPRLPGLVTVAGGPPRSLARELVARHRVLPVLDGLDEIGGSRHLQALAMIGASLAAGRRLVLTCRTGPYEQAVAETSPLPGAPVVEIVPLRVDDVCSYLWADPRGGVRWQALTTQLRNAPGDRQHLAEVMSNPLMVWLARRVYRSQSTDPDELLTADWATTRTNIEDHLLGRWVTAAYTTPTGRWPPRRPARVHRIEGWLSDLASLLRDRDTHDLAWWRLATHTTREICAAATALIGALTFGLASGLALGLPDGLGSGLIAAFLYGGAIGLPLGYLFGRMVAEDGLPLRLTCNRRVATIAGGGGLAYTLVLGLTARYEFEDTDWPMPSLASRPTAGVTFALVLALGSAFAFSVAFWLLRWQRLPYRLVWIELAVRGRTPWRLGAFLDEAHHRGVLRQSGGTYQFRHRRLRDHLARVGTGYLRELPGGQRQRDQRA